MAKRKDKKSLKVPNRYLESVNQRRTDNTMDKRKDKKRFFD
jgi:hypothetical protein